ncbi:MAG: hypothetical protein ABI723_13635 [Bacteroidia bacterium]
MKTKALITATILFFFTHISFAQQDSLALHDKTGTNPLNISNFMELGNEYSRAFANTNEHSDMVYIKYGNSFKKLRLNLNVKVPYQFAKHPEDGSVSGFGNIVLAANYVPYITNKNGISLTGEFNFRNGDENFNTEKNDMTLGAGFVFYHVRRSIITPYYKQSFSLNNHSTNANTNQGIIGLLFTSRSANQQWWLSLNPVMSMNYSTGNNFFTGKVEAGTLFTHSMSIALRPGIATGGSDRWSLAILLRKVF